jgi:hypothetical protein
VPNNIWIVSSNYRVSYDLEPDINDIDSSKHTVNGVDGNPLHAQFCLHSKNSTTDRKYCSFFIELSKGDTPAPDDWDYSGPTLPVLAFGWTRNISASKITPSYFDGGTWHDLGNTDQLAAWNILFMKVSTGTVEIDNTKDGVGSQTLDREYLGCFDTISMRSPANAGKERSVDDLWLVGGELRVPEPATLMLLGLTGLLLRRRR